MSGGNNLQEMEVGTKQSKTAVNSGAKAAEPMPKLAAGAVAGQTGSWEDLGGPTPENYKSDDDSAKLKDTTLKTVSNIVNSKAKSADPIQKMKEDEDFEDEEIIAEEETSEEVEEEILDEASCEDKEEDDEEEDDEEEVKKEEFDIEEDVNALLSGEELSEEFKEKATLIFESALKARVEQIREDLEVQYEEKLLEEIQDIKNTLEERVDAYLEYVSEEWINENRLSIGQGIKEEISESFMSGLKGLFEEHYVTIPEDKYDVLNSMVEKLDEMETKLNEQIERNITLNKRLAEAVAEGIFDEISEGLAATQKEKLASLAESVEFESEEKYREKLETLRESYFPNNVVSHQARTETLSEGADIAPEFYSNSMNAYLRALSATAPKN